MKKNYKWLTTTDYADIFNSEDYELDINDLRYLMNLIYTIEKEPALRERFVDREFDPKLNRSTLIRCRFKLQLFLRSNRLRPKVLDKPTQVSTNRGYKPKKSPKTE